MKQAEETPAQSFERLLREYREAMMLRWIHESQDLAAKNLARLVARLHRKGLLTVRDAGAGNGGGK